MYSPPPLVIFPTFNAKGISLSLHRSSSTCCASASNVKNLVFGTGAGTPRRSDVSGIVFVRHLIPYWGVRRNHTPVSLESKPAFTIRAQCSQRVLLRGLSLARIRQVLKEIAFLAMELTGVTSTNEDRLLSEPNEVELFSSRDQQLTKQETEDLRELRWELAFNHDTSGPFASELKAICSKISPAHASGIVYNEETQHVCDMRDEFHS